MIIRDITRLIVLLVLKYRKCLILQAFPVFFNSFYIACIPDAFSGYAWPSLQ